MFRNFAEKSQILWQKNYISKRLIGMGPVSFGKGKNGRGKVDRWRIATDDRESGALVAGAVFTDCEQAYFMKIKI